MHHRIQQFLVDGIESRSYALTPEELNVISTLIGKHKKVEDAMLCAVESQLAQLKGKKMMVEEYFLNFLVADETTPAKRLIDDKDTAKWPDASGYAVSSCANRQS
jgi:hypothetical protein